MMRTLNVATLLVTLALAFALYHVKYATQAEERQIRALKVELAAEQDAIQMLRADWSLLNDPQRLEELAQRYTDLEPLAPHQIITLADLPPRPPTAPGLEAAGPLGGYAGTFAASGVQQGGSIQ